MVNMYLETRIGGMRKTTGFYGYVLEFVDSRGETHTISTLEREDDVTPNQLILKAFIAALGRMRTPSEIAVYTDRIYLYGNFDRWLPVWKENGWQNAHGEQVKNRELWEQVERLSRLHLITFRSEYKHSYKSWLVSELFRMSREAKKR